MKQFNNILLGTTDDVLINIRETEVRYKERDVDEVMRKYEFARININNQSIKVNPTEKIICEYYYISGTVFLDLLVWAKKTFPTEIKNTLNDVFVWCGLQGKIDLPYLPAKSDLKSMFIYVNAIKFKDNPSKIQDFSSQLVSLQNVDYESCMNHFLVSKNQLEHYAANIIYYCTTDSLRYQELIIKRNILQDYFQLASLSCTTISNVFMNGVGCLVRNLYGRFASRRNILISMNRKGVIEMGKKYQ